MPVKLNSSLGARWGQKRVFGKNEKKEKEIIVNHLTNRLLVC